MFAQPGRFPFLRALAQACGFFWACFCLLALDHMTVVAMFYVFIEVKKGQIMLIKIEVPDSGREGRKRKDICKDEYERV